MESRTTISSTLALLGLFATIVVARPAPSDGAEGGSGDNLPPVCDAGPVQFVECNGVLATAQLDATLSYDPEGADLLFRWELTCPGGALDDDESPTPVLSFPLGELCLRECGAITLIVSDGELESSCTTAVVIEDTTPPSIQAPPDVLTLYTTGYPDQTDPSVTGTPTASDLCDPAPLVTYCDAVATGTPPTGIEIIVTRTWKVVDSCGFMDFDDQVITLVGESYFANQSALDLMPFHCPNVIPVHRGGAFTVAVLGSEDFDPSAIDSRFLVLHRPDGSAGVARPFRTRVKDIASPLEGASCQTLGGDGFPDLLLRFRVKDVVDGLDLDLVQNGSEMEVRLAARGFDGGLMHGLDRILIVNPSVP